jgi:FHA domain
VVRPLPGPGVVVRAGELLMVCADGPTGVNDLLTLVADVAAAGGDGADLVRRAAALIAMDESGRLPACAISGPVADGRVAVLVHGDATAGVMGGEGPLVLSGADSIGSANRLVAGPITEVRLQVPGVGSADGRMRLESGVVPGAGLILEAGGRAPAPAGKVAAQPEPIAAPAAASSEEVVGPAPAPEQTSIVDSADLAVPTWEPEPPVAPPTPEVHDAPGAPVPVPASDAPASVGVLALDDGSTFRLDVDYVIGREPQHDPDVVAGAARPLKIEDAEGVVSRKHLRVAVRDGDVRLIDLGSSNGTFVQLPDDPQQLRLLAGQPATIPPGTLVMIGRRSLRYEVDRSP